MYAVGVVIVTYVRQGKVQDGGQGQLCTYIMLVPLWSDWLWM